MNRLTVRGKFLYDGEDKFLARGVSYGPFPTNSRGERYPEPERADADFALMRQLGANLLRVYVPPPAWMFELARKHQLRMMVGMPWPFHMAFLDSAEMTRDIRRTIRDGVTAMREFADVIFAYSLGNEIRSDIVRWHGARAVSRFLRELYEIGKELDPQGLFTYSNYPSAEYLDLNFLDVVSFNVYLHREVDFRRYLTHLLATTDDRPLVLSETGMDTIREGEEHQADLLGWQARATFELGLSGFIVFAFTDEWHTGGAEITDWAFGLVTRDRQPKLAFHRVAEVFRGQLPPSLTESPKATVVVCAYNAAATLGRCLESLKHLNYRDYEVIVVDDGSTDDTALIAENAAVRVVKTTHRGLAAARNRGLAEARGRIVAFIDADAEADRDWLYHLVETLERSGAVAVGGRNFPPEPSSTVEAVIAAAPGEPREVPAGDDTLDQVCGCSMAVDKSRLPDPAPFDELFTTAGDDVDFSWSMHERGLKLAYAPGAVVIHRRRATIGAYLRQQAGYGRGERLLLRKYPDRMRRGDRVYGARGWARWFGSRPRIYYGAFGRGLFQSLYRNADTPSASELALTPGWIAGAISLVLLGALPVPKVLASPGFLGWHQSPLLMVIGALGVLLTIASAIWTARGRPIRKSTLPARVLLCLVALLGPWARGYGFHADASGWWRFADPASGRKRRWQRAGENVIEGSPGLSVEEVCAALRSALLKRRATVAVTDGYQAYDLQIRTFSPVNANLNLLRREGSVVVGWRIVPGSPSALASSFVVLLLLYLVFPAASVGLLLGMTIAALRVARSLPALVELAVADAAGTLAAPATPSTTRGAA
ncbi:MAG TPA: glycosyltransferase [Candidatus Binataceae bacterium]|nr:glycosyltransferase [Candidatus Binataceae bacterium]